MSLQHEPRPAPPSTPGLSVVGLFAGIGGLELGMARAGHRSLMLNEIDEKARAVLSAHFPDARITADVRALKTLPRTDVLTAGFPCTDVSQAGRKVGIDGAQSGLVSEIFRLLASRSVRTRPEWLVIENVSYMLRLDAGRAMTRIVDAVEDLGYRWAYRVVDARAFGVAQRRQRVLLVASRNHDPATVLLADDLGADVEYPDTVGETDESAAYGFYWTEGLRGLGWAKNAVPTIKGGSTIGIPSPPAVWIPRTGQVGTPSITVAEQLQGFPSGWTIAEYAGLREGTRWKQVGNAVCVPMSEWIGFRLRTPGTPLDVQRHPLRPGERWPSAAAGVAGHRYRIHVSHSPFAPGYDLRTQLTEDLKPLSARATAGFLSRANRGRLRFSIGFLDALDAHLAAQTEAA